MVLGPNNTIRIVTTRGKRIEVYLICKQLRPRDITKHCMKKIFPPKILFNQKTGGCAELSHSPWVVGMSNTEEFCQEKNPRKFSCKSYGDECCSKVIFLVSGSIHTLKNY